MVPLFSGELIDQWVVVLYQLTPSLELNFLYNKMDLVIQEW